MRIVDGILDTFDSFLVWLGNTLGQFSEVYCELETADDIQTLVAKDGSLVSVIKIEGATFLVGPEEFERIHKGLTQSLQTFLARPGHKIQVFFRHDKDTVTRDLEAILAPARQTASQLELSLEDLFSERVAELYHYCASESLYFVIWSGPQSLTKAQFEQSLKDKSDRLRTQHWPPIRNAQRFLQGIPELRDAHNALTRSLAADLNGLGLMSQVLDVHTACQAIRATIDPDFTDTKWKPSLPGDTLPLRESVEGELSDVLWPPLANQLIPRDGEILDLRTVRLGDRLYGTVTIDLFPSEVSAFGILFNRILQAQIPWRISFMLESGG